MDHAVCNFFSSAGDAAATTEVHFLEVFSDIVNGKYKQQIEKIRSNLNVRDVKDKLKKGLPGFTPCGTFNTRRSIKDSKSYNGIVPIDFDDIDHEDKANYLKYILSKDPYIACAFVSPSFGVKAFIETDVTDPKHHKKAFEACKKYIEGKYSSYLEFKVDPSGKDISRLCFVSYDPTAHINTSNEVMEIDTRYYISKQDFQIVGASHSDYAGETNVIRIIEFCIKGTNASRTGHYAKGNRNNWIYQTARSCNEYGVPEDQTFGYLSRRYSSLPYEEMKATIASAYKQNKSQFGTKTLRARNQKQQSLL